MLDALFATPDLNERATGLQFSLSWKESKETIDKSSILNLIALFSLSPLSPFRHEERATLAGAGVRRGQRVVGG